MPRMTSDAWISLWRPEFPYHADASLTTAGVHRGSREQALSAVHLELNTSGLKNMMTIDVDDPDAEWIVNLAVQTGLVPMYSWMTTNLSTGHAHVGWILKGGVAWSPMSRRAPRDYYRAVRLTLASKFEHGDLAYSGTFTRNPFHPQHETTWGTAHQYELKEIHHVLGDLLSPPRRKETSMDNIDTTEGRHQALYATVAGYAHSAWHEHYADADGEGKGRLTHEQAVLAFALAEHQERYAANPLPESEVRSLAKSAAKWTWSTFNSDEFAKIQSFRSRLRPVVQEKEQRVAYLKETAEQGVQWTAKMVMDQFSVSSRTAYNYLADAGLHEESKAITPEIQAVLDMREAGMSWAETAEQLGITREKARYLAKKAS